MTTTDSAPRIQPVQSAKVTDAHQAKLVGRYPRLDRSPGTVLRALAGADGAVEYEAHLRPGRVPAQSASHGLSPDRATDPGAIAKGGRPDAALSSPSQCQVDEPATSRRTFPPRNACDTASLIEERG